MLWRNKRDLNIVRIFPCAPLADKEGEREREKRFALNYDNVAQLRIEKFWIDIFSIAYEADELLERALQVINVKLRKHFRYTHTWNRDRNL